MTPHRATRGPARQRDARSPRRGAYRGRRGRPASREHVSSCLLREGLSPARTDARSERRPCEEFLCGCISHASFCPCLPSGMRTSTSSSSVGRLTVGPPRERLAGLCLRSPMSTSTRYQMRCSPPSCIRRALKEHRLGGQVFRTDARSNTLRWHGFRAAPRRPPCCRGSGRGARAGNTSGRPCPAPRARARARVDDFA